MRLLALTTKDTVKVLHKESRKYASGVESDSESEKTRRG